MATRVCATEVPMKLGSGVETLGELQARDASIRTAADARIEFNLDIFLLMFNNNDNPFYMDAKCLKYVPCDDRHSPP
jgi:hypothetical protein